MRRFILVGHERSWPYRSFTLTQLKKRWPRLIKCATCLVSLCAVFFTIQYLFNRLLEVEPNNVMLLPARVPSEPGSQLAGNDGGNSHLLISKDVFNDMPINLEERQKIGKSHTSELPSHFIDEKNVWKESGVRSSTREQRQQQKEFIYVSRNERIRQVCHRKGVVLKKPVFATQDNITQQILSSTSSDFILDTPARNDDETPITSHFSLIPSYKTMGCFLNKVASSSLVSAFLHAHGLGPTFSSPHSLAFHLFPKSLEDFRIANQTYFKFMFVRHPMDRMLSCYIDKMVKSPHISLPAFRGYVRKKGRDIINKRKQLKNKELLFEDQQFQFSELKNDRKNGLEAATYSSAPSPSPRNGMNFKTRTLLTHKKKRSATAAKKSLNNSSNFNVIPTFEEFLEFVLSTDLQGSGYDAHWVPYFRYCTPCSVKYHAIGKLETAAEDFQYIWSSTGLDSEIPVPWVNQNINDNKTKASSSKTELEMRYYSSLPRELILRFYEAFHLDFELFDYSINETLLKAGHKPLLPDELI